MGRNRYRRVDLFPITAAAVIVVLALLLFGPKAIRDNARKARDAAENAVQQAAEIVSPADENEPQGFSLSLIPEYSGEPYFIVNDDTPYFAEDEITAEAFEYYGDLDSLGRCTVAFGSYGPETVPPEGDERGDISGVTPTGWTQGRYKCIDDGNPDVVEDGYLYNRCHLVAWCISDEDDNPKNLITGTRYMNVDGMWVFEEQVQSYIYDTGNHVMYRVTPIFDGFDLLCKGVLMEAYSVEDSGTGVQFAVFCYNVQPGIWIDYSKGANGLSGTFLDTDASTVVFTG